MPDDIQEMSEEKLREIRRSFESPAVIKALGDDELRGLQKEVLAELDARREERLQKEREANAALLKKMLPHKKLILDLLEHDRTSCSDQDPCNGIEAGPSYRCCKCAFMELLDSAEYMTESEWYISFNVDLTRIV